MSPLQLSKTKKSRTKAERFKKVENPNKKQI